MFKLIVLVVFAVISGGACSEKIVKSGSQNRVQVSTNEQTQRFGNSSVEWKNTPRIDIVDSISKDRIWAVTAETAKLILTEDGGESWREVKDENIKFGFKLISFINDTHGWAIADANQLFSTTNSGLSWNKQSGENLFANPSKIEFTDAANGWVLDENHLFHSEDGGVSWKKISLTSDKYLKISFSDFFFLNSRQGWTCGISDKAGLVHKTTDSGRSWNTIKITLQTSNPCEIFFVDSEKGWVNFGHFGKQELFSTSDGGRSWTKLSGLPKGFEIKSIFWFNSKDGLAAGYFHNAEIDAPRFGKGSILKTFNGGESWVEVEIDKDVPFFDRIHFSDSQNGWLTSRDSIYVTANSGDTWKKSFNLPPLKE